MPTLPDVLHLLAILRRSVPNAKIVYTNGECFQLFRMLRTAFPQHKPEPYYDYVHGHIVTKMRGQFYDITGVVEESEKVKFLPVAEDLRLYRNAYTWAYNPNPIRPAQPWSWIAMMWYRLRTTGSFRCR